MSDNHFAAVREKADLVALVGELTGSKVKSRAPTDVRFIPCPFCGSKTGFSVNPQTKTYCCHHAGCEEKGDVFTFVKRVKGLARNWDALEFLAQRVGYKLPEARPLADERLGQVLALAQEVKRAAVEYYASRLWACRDESFTYTRDGEEHTTTVLGYQTETRGHSEVGAEVEEYPRKDGTQGMKNVVTFAGYKPVEELGAEGGGIVAS